MQFQITLRFSLRSENLMINRLFLFQIQKRDMAQALVTRGGGMGGEGGHEVKNISVLSVEI